ncbi:MAG TPA: DinB family protein [Candidatus Acidoferrales bacterium]|nr:DinB family protein [Candidatus Acidoferrales bacterium]
MATQEVQQGSVSAKFIRHWEQVNQKLVALAEQVPEGAFDYRPVEGVRTFAETLRHVAFWNQYLAESARGGKADDTANELSRTEYSTKTRIVDVLTSTADDATRALNDHASGLSKEVTDMLITFIEHNCEHYGQLVVYARLNGIVPPASRS